MYLYLILVIASVVCHFITDYKYENFKKEKGYVNNYKGSYRFKNFGKKPVFNILCLALDWLLPVVHLKSIIYLIFSKKLNDINLAYEEVCGQIKNVNSEIVNSDVVDLDEKSFKILSEDKTVKEQEKVRDFEFKNQYDEGELKEFVESVIADVKENDSTIQKKLVYEECAEYIESLLSKSEEYMDSLVNNSCHNSTSKLRKNINFKW